MKTTSFFDRKPWVLGFSFETLGVSKICDNRIPDNMPVPKNKGITFKETIF